MTNKKTSAILAGLILFSAFPAFQIANAQSSATQRVTATLTRPPKKEENNGGVIAIVTAGAAAVAGVGAASFAPLLLAGLSPNNAVAAAAPICCISCQESFLQSAILSHFNTDDLCCANSIMAGNGKFYIAQNDNRISNGTFDLQQLDLPRDFLDAKQILVNATIVSDPFAEVKNSPEIKLNIYKDISPADLRKKFETQQFLHYYLMKNYEINLIPTQKAYDKGIQQLTGVIDVAEIKSKDTPFHTVMTYTEGGFRRNQAKENPKFKIYGYLLEFEKINF